MSTSRILTGIVSVVILLTLATSARADIVHADMFLEKMIFAERHHLGDFDTLRAETGYLYAGHFENNNGKHLGFSISAFNRGPKLGIVRKPKIEVSPNPEPTAMVLLGTGLAAAAAFARRLNRKRL